MKTSCTVGGPKYVRNRAYAYYPKCNNGGKVKVGVITPFNEHFYAELTPLQATELADAILKMAGRCKEDRA
jgi:hypothetical protein